MQLFIQLFAFFKFASEQNDTKVIRDQAAADFLTKTLLIQWRRMIKTSISNSLATGTNTRLLFKYKEVNIAFNNWIKWHQWNRWNRLLKYFFINCDAGWGPCPCGQLRADVLRADNSPYYQLRDDPCKSRICTHEYVMKKINRKKM